MKLWIVILLFGFLGCSTDDSGVTASKLPEATQTGANIFACKIDGKIFVPRSGTGTLLSDDDALSWLGGYPSTAYNEIDARDFVSQKTGKILIHIQDLFTRKEGSYEVDESNGNSNIDGLSHSYIHCRIWSEKSSSYQHYRSFENSGTIEITRYDLEAGIVSGTFSCTLRNSVDPDDVIEITDGRFDINGYTVSQASFP